MEQTQSRPRCVQAGSPQVFPHASAYETAQEQRLPVACKVMQVPSHPTPLLLCAWLRVVEYLPWSQEGEAGREWDRPTACPGALEQAAHMSPHMLLPVRLLRSKDCL